MPFEPRTSPALHRTVGRALLVGAGVLALAAPAAATVADDTVERLVTVEGTVLNLAVEPAHDGSGDHGPADGTLDVETVVEVDGALYTLPDDVPVDPTTTGQPVEITLSADVALSPEEALEAATTDAVAPGEETPASNPDEAPVEQAEIVDVAAAAPLAGEVLAEAAVGSHSLTVLPVYWTSPDSTSVATLTSLAATTAQYWSEQSGGRIAVSTSVRGWAQIPAPSGCDTTALMNRALAAHGVAAPSGNQHVLVYFPKISECGGWAGLASIGGGRIWVNGSPLADVFAHEFGHNLGLGHANTATCASGGGRVPYSGSLASCTVRQYYDTADVMGFATSQASGSLNTALADHLGLVQVARPGTTTASVELAPLASVNAQRSLAIPVVGGVVYIDYRPYGGRDVRKPGWAGVQVHLRTIDPSYGYPTTYLLDMGAPATAEFAAAAFPVGGTWSVPGAGVSVTLDSAGSTARLRVSPGSTGTQPGTTKLEQYVTNVYLDLFGRPVDAGGLAAWTAALANGTPRVEVANGITYSREYRSRLITESYLTYLGRAPDGPGLEGWLGAMNRGVTIQEMEAGFLAAPEYYAYAGGTDAGWITRLYGHVLGRSPSWGEIQAWAAAANSSGRYAVSLGFLMSYEHLSEVVNDQYLALLGRGLDPDGQHGWVRAIQNGYRLEAVIGGIVASDEYFLQP